MQDILPPLLVVENLAEINEWHCNWLSDDEVAVIIPGYSQLYEIHFVWQEDLHCLHLVCFSELEVNEKVSYDFLKLLMLANQKVNIGTFTVLENNILAYRHVLHVSLENLGELDFLLQEVLAIAIEESDSFFPGFEKILENGTLSQDDLALLSLEVEGSA